MARPKLAIFKFASCDGCQLSLLDCEEELLAVAGLVEIANFLEASRAVVKGPYDLTLVEGSITTSHDAERIQQVRKQSRVLVTIGACATAGGIQALRNFKDVREFTSAVYATPEYISTLDASTPISQHVRVDFELRGCPISKAQLVEVLGSFLHGRRPSIPTYPVCLECKRRGTVCVMTAHGTPCLGPVTQAGCGAICPSYQRGCYGCFGPAEAPNTASLGNAWEKSLGASRPELVRAFRSFNAYSAPFRMASDAYEHERT
ncbi:MAG TPA: oxidoreductase [Vicinamibacteria bacterium]|nr:oxidoreductase [Vicinamibacteria bacterium]